MKILSFNINSIRARRHQLSAIVESHSPDIDGLQETKVTDEEFPLEAVNALGYQVDFHGQKGHYGVALLYREGMKAIRKGFEHDGEESQRRFIQGDFDLPGFGPLRVINCYFPQGDCRDHPSKFPGKQKFYSDLLTTLQERFDRNEPVIVMGDMNVALEDKDIGIGEDNRRRWLRDGKCSFLPEEREWLQALHD